MRKLVYGALALSAALTLSIGSVAATDADPTEAPEATEAPAAVETETFKTTVSVDGIYGDSLVLNAGDAKEVLVGTAKVSKSKTGEVMKVATWDTYVAGDGQVLVDLSKISTTKDSYIRIKADAEADSDAITIKLPAGSSKLKAVYDKAKENIKIENNKVAVKAGMTFRWRTVNGDTDVIDTVEGGVIDDTVLSLEAFRMSGGVIYLSAEQAGDPKNWDAGVKTTITEEDGTTPIYAVTAPIRRGKELKVTVAKRANAPKLSVNYVNGTISIPAKAQYRVLNTEGEELPKFSDATTAKVTLALGTVNEKDKTVDASKPFAIDVQTAKDAKKPASRIGHTTFAAQTVTDAKDVAVTDVTANTKAEKDGSFTATVKLKNNSKTEVYALTYTPFGATKAKTVKIAAGKEVNATKVVTASAVSLQRVGNAKTKSWAGAAVKFNSIDDLKAGAGSVDTPNTPAAKEYTLAFDGEATADGIDSITVDGESVSVSDSIKVKEGAKVVIVSAENYTIDFKSVVSPETETAGSGKKVVTTYTFVMPGKDVAGTIE